MLQIAALDRPLTGRASDRQRTVRPARRSGLGARLRGAARRCRPSLTVGLVGLAVMLAVVPIAYYDQQRQSEGKYGSMLRLWADNETRLAARALAPILETPGATPFRLVQDQLATLTAAGRQMYLMFHPAGGNDEGFYVVASAPQVSLNGLETEWREWGNQTSWPSFGALCAAGGSEAVAQRGPDAVPATVRAAVSIPTARGCWVLVTAYDSQYMNSVTGGPRKSWIGIGGVAAALYLAAIALAALIWLRSWRGLTHLGRVAREITENGAQAQPFARRNKLPELAHVATDFDRLVTTLHDATESLRRNAEDNAHALKTPLATIRHSLQPIKRSLTVENDRAKRAVDLIEQSITRLEALVGSAQRVEPQDTAPQEAETGDRARRPVDLSRALSNVLLYYRKLLAARNLVVVERLHPGVTVEAAPGTIESIVNNVIDNAISFSPAGGEIAIRLLKIDGGCELVIEDDGPGVDPASIDRIFDRYVSLRPKRPIADSRGSPLDNLHSGLGLWIVRRNVEALGGSVAAGNRPGGGLSIRIALPTLP
jgi:two-component system, OmpR family, sensor histidine kinase ChvG